MDIKKVVASAVGMLALNMGGMSLRAEDAAFTVSYEGKTLFSVTDKTFGEAGGVALWTKADSVTRFDRLTITPLP